MRKKRLRRLGIENNEYVENGTTMSDFKNAKERLCRDLDIFANEVDELKRVIKTKEKELKNHNLK